MENAGSGETQNSEKMMSCYIPEEIIFGILSRLPVKSLLRFKSVSKSWCCLISSSTFIKAHLDRTAHSSSSLLFIHRPDHISNYNLISCISLDSPRVLVNIDSTPTGVWIVGSCNGLVLLNDRIWNPATKQSKILPPCTIDAVGHFCLGLGFDFVTHDFKVVRAVFPYHSKEVWAEVYTANADSWRKIEVVGDSWMEDEAFRDCVAVVKGDPYWLDYPKRELVSFDIHREVWGRVSLPDITKYEQTHGWTVVHFLDSLAIIVFPERVSEGKDKRLTVWTMDGSYGKELWTQKIVCEVNIQIVWPYMYLKSGEIVAACTKSTPIIYDPESKEIKNAALPVVAPGDVYYYTESLYPVRGSNQVLLKA